MPRGKSKSKLEKIETEAVEVNLEDIKTKEDKSKTTSKSKTKEAGPETIHTALNEIKTKEGVIGYILRNTKSASIDLNDPAKLIDYAVLSSSAMEAGDELSQTFDLGEIENVLVEGRDVKLLSLTIGENNISIFMEKNVDHDKVYKTLSKVS